MFEESHKPKEHDKNIKLSLEEARNADYPVYWTGKRCLRGHIAHRYTSNRNCTVCRAIDGRIAKTNAAIRDLGKSGINMDLRRKIEDARIDARAAVDDWDY